MNRMMFMVVCLLLFGCGNVDGNNNAKVEVDVDGDGLIEINTAEKLNNIRYNLAGTSYKTSATDTGDSSGCPAQGCVGYELINNIDLVSFANWTPIQGEHSTSITTSRGCVLGESGAWDGTGCIVPLFSAIFNGNDNTISNLTVSSGTGFVGLFGVVSGTIRDLKLRGGLITAGTRTGALAGYLLSDVIIENVSSDLAVSGNGYVGGLAGENLGEIVRSNTTGVVTGGTNTDSVGGLVGNNSGGGTIRGSNATVAVNGGAGTDRVGGLVGDNSGGGTIHGSNATGAVNGGAGPDFAGGLVGGSYGNIWNSYAIGFVTIDSGVAGGLVGESYGKILNSYATGFVSGGSGTSNVGGLVGIINANSTVQNSYATGSVNGGDGTDYVGGLVGINYSGGTAENSYATSAVNGGAGAGDYVGGLVGLNYGTVKNSYALVKVYGGAGAGDNVGRVVGGNGDNGGSGVAFGNYYSTAFTLEGETKRTIGTDEAVGKDADGLKALTAVITGTDFTSTDTTDGWSTNNWDFTATKYPSLKSFKTNASDVQVDGDLLCTQGVDWNLGDEWVQC